MIQHTSPANWTYHGEEYLDDLDESAALTIPEGTDAVIISAFGKGVTVRLSGEDAEADKGVPIAAGGYELFNVDPLSNIRLIEQEATATAHATFLLRKDARP